MFLDASQYRKDDSSLRFFCSLLSEFILTNYKYNRVFTPDFLLGEIFNADRALIVYKDKDCKEIVFFLSCSLDYKEKDLACRLLVGNMRVSLVYAIGYCMNLILNSAFNSLSFYVLDDNKEMLSLCTKAGMAEVESDLIRRKKFKTQITSLIAIFREYYNRFTLYFDKEPFQELILSQDMCYINNSSSLKKTCFQYSENGYYFKLYDKSIHAAQDINEHIYNESTAGGLSHVLKEHLLNGEENTERIDETKTGFIYAPTDLFIFPTFACNLRCRYCYSEATPLKRKLSYQRARIGIDYIVSNAIRRGSKSISITFHGGGEPTVNIELVNQIISYCLTKAEENQLKVNISGSTNATNYNKEVYQFLSHCSSIQFSFDGTKIVQDLHRPFANESSSYQTVVDNIRKIHSDFPSLAFSIRSTVSQESICEMQESVRLFAELGANTIVFEPLLEIGRALDNAGTITAPNIISFSDELTNCKMLGFELGVKVKSSGDAMFRIGTFCGASRENCVLTPDGLISTCVEVSDDADSLSEFFLIGRIEKGEVKIDEEKVKRIQGMGRQIHPECTYCIAERSCRGNCLTRTLRANKTPRHFLLNQLCIMQTRLMINNMETLHSRCENPL